MSLNAKEDSDKKTMVLNAILKKIGILIKGAEKRNNQEIIFEKEVKKTHDISKVIDSLEMDDNRFEEIINALKNVGEITESTENGVP